MGSYVKNVVDYWGTLTLGPEVGVMRYCNQHVLKDSTPWGLSPHSNRQSSTRTAPYLHPVWWSSMFWLAAAYFSGQSGRDLHMRKLGVWKWEHAAGILWESSSGLDHISISFACSGTCSSEYSTIIISSSVFSVSLTSGLSAAGADSSSINIGTVSSCSSYDCCSSFGTLLHDGSNSWGQDESPTIDVGLFDYFLCSFRPSEQRW